MRSPLVLMGLLALVVRCSSYCDYREFTDANPNCVDTSGTVYKKGDVWVDGCYACSCMNEGYTCCPMINGLDADIPEGCEMLIDMEKCVADVVSTEDYVTPCKKP